MQEKHYKHNCPPENYVRKGCFSDHNTLSTYPNKRLVERIIRRSPKQKTLSKDEALYFYELAYLLSQTNNPNDAIGEWIQVSMYGSVLEAILRTLLEERYCDNWLSLDLYFEDFSKPRNPNPTNQYYTIADYRDDRIETFSKDLKSLNRSWNTSKHAKALIPSEDEEKLYQRTEKPEDCYRWLCEFILYTSDVPIPEEYKKAYGGKAFDNSLMRDLLNANNDNDTISQEQIKDKSIAISLSKEKPNIGTLPIPSEQPKQQQKRMPILFVIDTDNELKNKNLLEAISNTLFGFIEELKAYPFIDIGIVCVDEAGIDQIYLRPVSDFLSKCEQDFITWRGCGRGDLMLGLKAAYSNLESYILLTDHNPKYGMVILIASNNRKLNIKFHKQSDPLFRDRQMLIRGINLWYTFILHRENIFKKLGHKILSNVLGIDIETPFENSQELQFFTSFPNFKKEIIESADNMASELYHNKTLSIEQAETL